MAAIFSQPQCVNLLSIIDHRTKSYIELSKDTALSDDGGRILQKMNHVIIGPGCVGGK